MAEFPGAPLSVYVVWEPVIVTDVARPTTTVLGLLDDARARQFWDPERTLSERILRDINRSPQHYGFDEALPSDFVVWDAVLVFRRSERWEETLPVPLYHDGPVVDVIEDTRRAIAAALSAAPQ